MDGNGVDIVVINEQRSVRHVVGAEQQIDDGRFSGTGLSDDADTLARLNGKRYVFQHIVLPVRIAEGQIAELDFSMDGRQILHTAAVLHIDFCVSSSVIRFKDAFPRDVFSISMETAMIGHTTAEK